MARTAPIARLCLHAGRAWGLILALGGPVAAALGQPTPQAVVEVRLVADTQPGSPFVAGAAGALPPGVLGANSITTGVGVTLQARVTTTGTFANWGVSRVGFSAGTVSWITHDDALSSTTGPLWPSALAALQRGDTGQPGAPAPRRGLFNLFRGTVSAEANAATGNGTATAPFPNGLLQLGAVAQPGDVWVPGSTGAAGLVAIDGLAQVQPGAGAFSNATPPDATSSTVVVGPWQSVYRFVFVPRSDGFTLPSRQVTVRAAARVQWASELTDISGVGSGPFALSAAPAPWQDASLKPASITFVVNTSAQPIITRQPVPASAPLLGSATLSVEFQPSIATVQWRRNGQPIAGATSPTLTLNPASLSEAGEYDAVVSTPTGSVTSQPATVTLDTCGVWWSAVATPAGSAPSARSAHKAVFDPGASRVVLFGGASGPAGLPSPLGDAWAWDGAGWAQVSPGAGGGSVPSARWGHAMVYDPVRSRVLLFGGHDGAAPLGDTWELDGSVWTRRATSGPAPRSGAALVWDAARQRAVLVGGQGAGSLLGDTWEWNGTAWSPVFPAAAPPARRDAAAVFDPARGRTVIAAGTGAGGAALADTWEFTGTNWLPVTGPRPAPPGPATAVFDTTRGRALLVSHADTSVWQLEGSAWLKLADGTTPAAPPARALPAVAHHAGRRGLLVHGGLNPTTPPASPSQATPSASASLLRLASPVVLSGPAPREACEGSTVTLTVEAVAAPGQSLTYRWRRDGADVAGGNGPSLSFAAGASTVGSYECTVSTPCGSATTTAAVTTRALPFISAQPASVERCAGSPANLAVTVANSGGSTYQWRRLDAGGGAPQNVVGATGPTLAFGAVATADAGEYDCVITTPCGVLTTAPASITVATPVSIVTQPAPPTAPGTSLCAGAPVVLSVVAAGSPVRYQWRRNGAGIDGATAATIALTASDAAAGTYVCVASNACGSVTTAPVVVAVAPATAITGLVGPASVEPGATVTLRVQAVGGAPLTYRWRRGGQPLADGGALSGTATDTLVIAGFRTSDSGAYGVVVTGPCGVAVSPDFTLAPGPGTEVLYVNANAATPGDGRSWAAPFTTIRAAAEHAAAHPTPPGVVRQLWVARGTYSPAPGVDTPIRLPGGLTVLGGFAGTEPDATARNPAANPTVLSGDRLGNDPPLPHDPLAPLDPARDDNAGTLVEVLAGAATIDGLTLIGAVARSPDGSGAVGVGPGASLTLRDCTIAGNLGGRGGAATLSASGSLRLESCRLEGNAALGDGGAVFVGESATLRAAGGSMTANAAAGAGGAVAVEAGGSFAAARLRIGANAAGWQGGGVAVLGERASLALACCALSANSARHRGGALALAPKATASIGNCTLWADAAPLGSALWLDDAAQATVVNTIVWSSPQPGAGAPDAEGLLAGPGVFALRACLVEGWGPAWAASRPGQDAPVQVSGDHPLLRRAAGLDGVAGTPDDDFTPLPGSPAIDAAITADIPADPTGAEAGASTPIATDLLGAPRSQTNPYAGAGAAPQPRADIGAVEAVIFCPPDIAAASGEPGPDGAVDNGDFSLFIRAYVAPIDDPLRAVADIADSQALPGADGAVDNGDFQLFFSLFFAGCR